MITETESPIIQGHEDLQVKQMLARKEAFEKERDRIYDLWKDQLKDFPEDRVKQVALILENQRLFFEGGGQSHFRAIGLEVTKRALQGFVGFDLVSIQPIRFPSDYVYQTPIKVVTETNQEDLPSLSFARDIEEHQLSARTRNMRVESVEDFNPERIEDLAIEVRNDLSREIMTDLRNNCGTVAKKAEKVENLSYEEIFINVVEVSSVIHRKTLRGGANWIATSPKIAKKFPVEFEEAQLTGPTLVGTVNSKWKIVVDPLFPENELLLGNNEPEGMFDSYVYSPYIFLTATGVILDQESLKPRFGLMTRYGKYLFRSGCKYFARMSYS